jgi:hypothetical protein
MERSKNFHIWLGISALLIAGSAGFFSVFGLSKLFAGAALSVIIMAGSLELGKLVTAAFIYRYWKQINWLQKSYMTLAVVVLIGITSAGIFGYLSNAYQGATIAFEKQSTSLFYKEDRLEQLEEDKVYLKEELEQSIASLPENYITAKRKLREEYNPKVLTLNDEILEIKQDISDLKVELVETGVDVGPAIYLAKIFNTDIDTVVKFFIFILIFVFDPLAVMLVVAFNQALVLREGETPRTRIARGGGAKRKNWWEVYGEKKNSILKREEIVEPEKEIVEVIKETDDSDDRVTEVKPTEARYLGKGGIRTRPGSV